MFSCSVDQKKQKKSNNNAIVEWKKALMKILEEKSIRVIAVKIFLAFDLLTHFVVLSVMQLATYEHALEMPNFNMRM
jgi:hypothetical protein